MSTSQTSQTFGYAIEIKGSNGLGKTHGHYAISTSGCVCAWVRDTRTGDEYQGHARAVFSTEAEAREIALSLIWSGQTFAIRRAKLA